MSKKCWATKAPEGDTRAATECSCLPAGSQLGSRVSFWPCPREWTYDSRSTELPRARGSVRPAAVRGTCGPLEHRCSATLWEDGGRDSGVSGTAHPLCLEHSALLIPRSSASFLQGSSPHTESGPSSGLPHPDGFPHPGLATMGCHWRWICHPH